MSCVVGIVDNEAVWMAADSLNSIEGVEGWCTASSNPKIIRKDDVLIGYVGSARLGDIIANDVAIPLKTEYFIANLVDILSEEFGFNDCLDSSGTFDGALLVGYVHETPQLVMIGSDFGTLKPSSGYIAIGSGSPLAMGALCATEGWDAKTRLHAAMRAAQEHSPYVRCPFIYETVALPAKTEQASATLVEMWEGHPTVG